MYPYGWGFGPFNDVGNSAALAALVGSDSFGFRNLPEEVREAIEARKDEIYSEEDLRRIINEQMLRR